MNNYEEMKAKREARELADNMKRLQEDRDYTVENGIMTWDSNGRVPFDDMLRAAAELGENIDFDACAAKRDADNAEFLKGYMKAQAERTPEQIAEERFEARAAMGPGVEMVNIFTGERYTT